MLEGAIEPKAIAEAAKRHGFPAVALCDRNGLYAAMAFSDACEAAGVQPIIGALVSVTRPDDVAAGQGGVDRLALYAQDDAGYANLCRIVSDAHLCPESGCEPQVTLDQLGERSEGLICLTAGGEGALARLLAEGQGEGARRYLDRLAPLFPGRLYIELSRRDDTIEDAAEDALIDLAYAADLPLVATNPACFDEPEFHAAHDALLCIAQSAYVDSAERRRSCPHAYLKSADAMAEIFADVPEALANTLVVAQRCAVRAPSRKPILPSIAGDRDAEAEQLRRDAHAGLVDRLRAMEALDGGSPRTSEALEAAYPEYFERLAFETDVIVGMGFPGYFLIVADFIKWAKANDIPVGPGRGSGAGSVVAWALTITDLDPLKLGLLFERFLNPERVSMPDFDIDFCETRRGEVIRYVQQKYGRDTVAQIITFGTMKARAVLKDTGRVLQMGYNRVDRLAKMVPNHPTDPWTLERSLGRGSDKNGRPHVAAPDFLAAYKQEPEVRRLVDMAMRLEGLPRHSSTHAAGVVIGDRPLAELVPLYRDPRSDMPVTQFDMKYVEGAGLVKFDFLGLKTLSVLKEAVRLLEEQGTHIDLDALSWDDPEVYALLQRGDTVGVFQLESEGMRRTLAAVKPTSFGDIIALVSLYRPGPMDNIPSFGARKNGREDIGYPHPLLEPILNETYGIIVYQEQVMQAAQVLAGYSLGEADLLRRAMGKKKKEEMDAQRARFVDGCGKNGIIKEKANELFDLIDKFAGYGFNKSHAAAYALLAYQTAWLKAHHPHAFFAASMSFDIDVTDKLALFVDDARRSDVVVAPPCLNQSRAAFSVERVGEGWQVRYGLGALKGVGEKAMETVVAERTRGGEFRNLDDFAERIDPRLLNRRQIEALAGAGALDGLGHERAAVFAGAETLLAAAARAAETRESGQGGLFGGDVATMPAVHLPAAPAWSLAETMAREKDAFGFYFSAHPVSRYELLTTALRTREYGSLAGDTPAAPGERRAATMAALVESVKWRTSQRGNRYAMLMLSDRSGQYPASCFDAGTGEALEAMAESGACALLQVELDWREGEETPRVTVRSAEDLERRMATSALALTVEIESAAPVPTLKRLVAEARTGRSSILVRVVANDGSDAPIAEARLCQRCHFDQEDVHRLERIDGVRHVRLAPAPARAASG